MTIHKDNIRIKVTVSKTLKEQLDIVAKQKDRPLSWLFLDAVVRVYITGERKRPEKKVLKMPMVDAPVPKKSKPIQNFTRSNEVLIKATGEQRTLEELIERFSVKDRMVRARLCQLGGRKGDLFRGSIQHAQIVEEVTRRYDPEGLPWMPLNENRTLWVCMSAKEYVNQILKSE